MMRAAEDWTRDHVPDLTGRVMLITGANSGIGYEAARLLAGRGAAVTLACRNLQRGHEALSRVRAQAPDASIELLEVDLGDLDSVRAAAERWRGSHERLDALINNAGVMAPPLRRTTDGFELQFGVNHLGHFALTGRLLDALLAADRPRVVTVSSGAHRMGSIAFDDLNWTHRRYTPFGAYAQSKLANLLFTFELQRRSASAGSDLNALAAHPGYAATELQARGPQMRGSAITERLSRLANRVFAQSADQGALPTVAAATLPNAEGADYWGPNGRFGVRGLPARGPVSASATDMVAAAQLWDRSEQLTGVTFAALRRTPA